MGSGQDETPPSRVANSPGNAYRINTDAPAMRLPHLSFIWRLECAIAPELTVGRPHDGSSSRSVMNILAGEFRGPKVRGKVLPGGADWAVNVEGTHSTQLNAHYTVQTDDGEHLYVRAFGLYRPGPGTEYAANVARDPSQPSKEVVTQDDVEFFSHLRVEAAGSGRYNWLNGLICVGVMTFVKDRIVIDAYHLTNFPGVEAESVLARRGIVKGKRNANGAKL